MNRSVVIQLGAIEAGLLDVLEQARGDGAQVVTLVPGAEPAGALDEAARWRLERFPLPIIFAAAGEIRGAAFDIAVLADIRVCEAGTRFVAGPDAPARLAVLLRGRELPAEFDAQSAWEAGFVSEVTAAGERLAAAERIATTITSRGPIATRLAKEAVWRGLPQAFEQALRFETDLTLLLQTTKDRAEGVRAFVEKRTPAFTGE